MVLFPFILNTELQSDILIYGTKARNRAIHGDVVVVELLPVHEWKGRTVALCENETEDKAPADTTGDPMPTGKEKHPLNSLLINNGGKKSGEKVSPCDMPGCHGNLEPCLKLLLCSCFLEVC